MMSNCFSVCPFYRTRSLVDEADLLLMPYNYVIDPRLRRMHDVGLKGNIVIFDEAHNLVPSSIFISLRMLIFASSVIRRMDFTPLST